VGNQLSSVPQVLANHTLHSAPNDLGLPSNLTESQVLAVEMYDSLLLEQCELSFHDLLHKIRDTAINNLLFLNDFQAGTRGSMQKQKGFVVRLRT
jgi:hypothetical protein